MLPIFTEYRKMLSDFNIDLSEYANNKLWIDKMIIKGFDKQGIIKKICRLKIKDDMTYTYKFYRDILSNDDLMSYEETYMFFENEIRERERVFKLQKI